MPKISMPTQQTPPAPSTQRAAPEQESVVGAFFSGLADGLHDTFVKGDNPFYRSYKAEQEHLDKAAELFGDQGDGALKAGAKLTGVLISDATGATDLYEAGSGKDISHFVQTGDVRELSGKERALKGVTGAVKLAGAATASPSAAVSGHGAMERTLFRLPKNVSVNVYSKSGEPLANDVGQLIESGRGTPSPVGTFKGGTTMPDHTLYPIQDSALAPQGGKIMVRVSEPTRLSELAQQVSGANGGRPVTLDWAACRSPALDSAAKAATEVGGANAANQSGRLLGTLDQEKQKK